MANTMPKNSNYSPPDYDFGDEIFYKQAEPEKPRRQMDISILVTMLFFVLIVIGTYAAIKLMPGMEFKMGSFFTALSNKPQADTVVGNIKLGSTLDVLREKYPYAEKAVAANGALTMGYDDGDSRYTIWYGEDGPYHIAYKARQYRVLPGVSEDDYVNDIVKKFGAPSVSTCSRSIVDGMRDCRFSWWMPDELRLDLTSRQDTSTKDPRLMVTLVATDTRLEGRIQRAHLNTTASR